MFLLFVAKKKKTNAVCIIPACPTPEANFSRPRHVFRNLGLGPLRLESNWRQCSEWAKFTICQDFLVKIDYLYVVLAIRLSWTSSNSPSVTVESNQCNLYKPGHRISCEINYMPIFVIRSFTFDEIESRSRFFRFDGVESRSPNCFWRLQFKLNYKPSRL